MAPPNPRFSRVPAFLPSESSSVARIYKLLLQHAGVRPGPVISFRINSTLLTFFSLGVLHDEIRTRPEAVNHLCKYLSEHYDYTELTELYR